MTRCARLLPLCLLATTLAAAGCGGKSDAQARQSFLNQANTLCDHYEQLRNDVQFPVGDPREPGLSAIKRAQWALALNQIVHYGQDEIRGLRRMEPPKDLRDGFRRLIAEKETAYDLLAEGADAAKRNRVSKIQAPVAAARKTLASMSAQAKKLGLPRCA